MKNKIVVFHPLIAPYRLDLFNDIATKWGASIYLVYRKYWRFQNYDKEVSSRFKFVPNYIYRETNENKGAGGISLQYWRILHKENPDYVFVWEFGTITILTILYKLIFFRKYKIITFCDDSGDMLQNARFRHKVARTIIANFLNNVVVSSPEVQSWFRRRYNLGIFFPIIRDDKIARSRLESDVVLRYSEKVSRDLSIVNKNIFLFVGRLDPEKNVGELIKVFQDVSEENDLLLIVGSGTKESEYAQYVKRNNITNIFFLGRKEGDELIAIYNLADVFILPSLYEPFGAVTNEALIFGCFSIISDKAGSRCLIENGVNGFIFSPNSKTELGQAIIMSRNKIKDKVKQFPKPNLMKVTYREFFNKLTKEVFYGDKNSIDL